MGDVQHPPMNSLGVLGRRVVVAGDVTMDWHLARSRKSVDSGSCWSAGDRTEVYGQLGGASLTMGLMTEVGATLAGGGVGVLVSGPSVPSGVAAPTDSGLHHSYASWSQFPRRRGDRDRTVWRVEEFLGVDKARTPEGTASGEQISNCEGGLPAPADLVILDDADLGFRAQTALWPRELNLHEGEGTVAGMSPPWVVLKMAHPVCSGELWRRLLRKQHGRLVVVMTLNDLRLSDVQISRELSWERIASDLAREVLHHPTVNGLTYCAHVVVSLGTGGAVLFSRRPQAEDGPGRLTRPDIHVFFDPDAIENSWAEQHPGTVIGYTTCLVGGIARQLLLNPGHPDIHRGVASGLAAGRALHLMGYGADPRVPDRADLAFPAGAIARELAKEPVGFASAPVAQPMTDSWSILEGRYPEGLEPVAVAVAREGAEAALSGVPRGVFGKFVTVDRGEIEGFRSIRALMREYDAQPAPRPLNIAVFGPPGAGKSFGVKAVVKSALDGDRVEELTFNLSQMRDPTEMVDALHQIRDAGLRGKLPFVLWDEFDAHVAGEPFGWLRHFLAPMQDGAFQQGQILHPLGKAIFVFAGGTSSRLVDFAGNRSSEFRLAKGPDFVSRLKGHVDIVGPDPRGGDPDADPYYRIRRAILLRSMLLRDRPALFERDGKTSRLAIDPGVLRAFLEVRSYRHGARSLETILAMSTLHGKSRYERSELPAADQLDAHVDAREFLTLVEQFVPEGDLLERLAEAVHLEYCAGMLSLGHPWCGTIECLTGTPMLAKHADRTPTEAPVPALIDYRMLSEHDKEQNRGVARGLPAKLAFLGYLLRQDAPGTPEDVHIDPADPRVDVLAKREHERWVRRQRKAGWRYGDPRDDAEKLHPCIRAWDELPEAEQVKDRAAIMTMPEIVAAAGLKLTRGEEPAVLRIGVTGHRVLAEVPRIQAGIEEVIGRIESTHPGQPLVIVSALAEGADRIVTRAILKRPGSRLEALLPLPKFDFLNDFASAQSKEDFLRLLADADHVVEQPSQTTREAAYTEANEHILDNVDVLIAVWDGQEAQGNAGTAHVVARSRSRGLPLAWIHAGNRLPGTEEPTALGADQGAVTFENFN